MIDPDHIIFEESQSLVSFSVFYLLTVTPFFGTPFETIGLIPLNRNWFSKSLIKSRGWPRNQQAGISHGSP